MVVITGLATSPVYSNNSDISRYMSVTLTDDFFSSIENAKYVLCTNVVTKDEKFITAPFYGDIYVGYRIEKQTVDVSFSYIGEIDIYINEEESLSVVTKNKKSLISLPNTSWFEAFFPPKTDDNKGEQS